MTLDDLTPLHTWIAATVGDVAGAAGGPIDRAILERHQLERLNLTLGHARSHGRAWQGRLAGVPAPLSSLAELGRLPFTTSDEIASDPAAFVCVPQGEVERIVTLQTSGTTGPPKRVFFTREDQALTVDFFRVGMAVFTRPGDRVLILLPGQTVGSVGELLGRALEQLGAVPIQHGPVRDPAETLRVAREEAATVAVGIPLHLLRLARSGASIEGLALRDVLLSSDQAAPTVVEAIERGLGCTVFDHYGMTETGLGGGVDCRLRRGYHLREADLLFEIVDPASGEAVADGAEGEVVFTTLNRAAMPLIRYRTGDTGRWLPGPCPCGTNLRTLAHVTDRVGARHRLPDGTWLTQARLDTVLLADGRVLDLAARLAPGEAPRLEVDLEVGPGADADEVRRWASEVLECLVRIPEVGAPAGWSLRVTAGHDRVHPATPAKRRVEVVAPTAERLTIGIAP